MKTVSLLLLCILWSVPVLPNDASASLFGPSNFSACILENVDSSATRGAAKLIYESCKNKFPDTKDSTGGLGMFGPSDFDECIFKYASGVRESSVGRVIYTSCRTLFPKETAVTSTSSTRRGILLGAAEVAGKYVAAARALDELRPSVCSGIVAQQNLPTASMVAQQILAEFPASERPKVKNGLEQMYQNLPGPYAKWGGVAPYIQKLTDELGKDAACGVVWGEVSSMMGTAETEWTAARAQLRTLDQ